MANFQATLFDAVADKMAITLDQECNVLTIIDKSDYLTATDSGHELMGYFDTFRQLEIKRPNGTSFNYDAEGNMDGQWDAPFNGTTTITHNMEEDSADGVYEVTLYVAPTYQAGSTYTHSTANPKSVYYLGQLYKTIATTTGNLPTDEDYWVECTREDLSSKYRTTETFALTCRKLTRCYERLVHEANCIIRDEHCDDDLLCTNKEFLGAMKLRLAIDGISYAAKNRKWNEVKSISNLANKICSC